MYDQLYLACIEQKTSNVLGRPDNIKTFSLQAFSNGTAVTSTFDELEYILNKSYGFVKFLPFVELFNSPKTTTTLYGFEDRNEILIGDRYNSTHIFPYQQDDILTYFSEERFYGPSSYYGDIYIFYHDSVIDSNKYQNTFTYMYDRYKIVSSRNTVDTVQYANRSNTIDLSQYAYLEESIYINWK